MFPFGSLARSRKDWLIDKLRAGTQSSNGSGNTLYPIHGLNNNDKSGGYIALYGIIAIANGTYQLAQYGLTTGLGTLPSPNLDFQININSAATPGYTSTRTAVPPFAVNNSGPVFKADGARIFSFGDVPLIIIPPNFRVEVFAMNYGTVNLSGNGLTTTFYWAPYQSSTLPRARGFTS